MITVDGEPVTPGPAGSDPHEEARRLARLELKLYKSLVALGPPPELSVSLHARIAETLRRMRLEGTMHDPDARELADFTDDELRQAAAVIRAIRALPFWNEKSYKGGTGFRVDLSGYALDLIDELDKRTGPAAEP